MTCMSASTKASKFGLQVSFQSLWSSLVWPDLAQFNNLVTTRRGNTCIQMELFHQNSIIS